MIINYDYFVYNFLKNFKLVVKLFEIKIKPYL